MRIYRRLLKRAAISTGVTLYAQVLADYNASVMAKHKTWDDLYTTKVKAEEILYVVTNMSRLHEDEKNPNFYTAMFIVTDHYKGKKNAVEKSFVIIERLQCLTRLIEKKDARMRGWTMEGVEEGCLLTNEAVFTATALCPMKKKEDERWMNFDPDEFFDIVLRESESQGTG